MFEIRTGDCLEVLRGMADSSVDSIVTDPPYGLSFMGKKWDYDVPDVAVWAECLRVLKPGGHLLAFAGTRTQHRMAVRIEDAGFEIRDMIAWVYGSGFPKSLDVSKAIDRAGGGCGFPENDRLEFARELRAKREAAGVTRKDLASWFPYAEVTKNWERLDVGFRVPSEADYQVLIDRLGVSEAWRLRVRAEDKRRLVSEDGQDRRGDGSVIGLGHSGREWEATTDAARQWSGWGTALKPAMEPITVARKPLVGTVAANVLEHGTGALNVDRCRVAAAAGDQPKACRAPGWDSMNKANAAAGYRPGEYQQGEAEYRPNAAGRWPANLIHDGSEDVVALFPQSSVTGNRRDPNREYSDGRDSQLSWKNNHAGSEYTDTGSAARFFYCAKASKRDRDEGCEGQNNHPTVKPTDLMRYLCRLVTPPGGLVLDPFAGSGSTGRGAVLEGFRFLGMEREADYVAIANARIQAAVDSLGLLHRG